METIYLSLRAQVAVGTFFMKSPVGMLDYQGKIIVILQCTINLECYLELELDKMIVLLKDHIFLII